MPVNHLSDLFEDATCMRDPADVGDGIVNTEATLGLEKENQRLIFNFDLKSTVQIRSDERLRFLLVILPVEAPITHLQ
jgi:hypothetical protein